MCFTTHLLLLKNIVCLDVKLYIIDAQCVINTTNI